MKDIQENTYEEDLELMERIPRKAYIEIYTLIREHMWEYCTVPSVGDVVDFLSGKENKMFDEVSAFLDNKDKLESLLSKEDSKYTNEESEVFIDKVISSNVTDISDSGWFYKKLMASTDDISIVEEDCFGSGVEYKVKDLNEEIYEFRIRYSYVIEINGNAKEMFDDFIKTVDKYKTIHVKSPISCHNAPIRRLCAKCSGVVKKAKDNYYTPINFGIFSTLMITEHATQASLDSMNKGTSENINKILDRKIGTKSMIWDEVTSEINSIVSHIGNVGVQARFYEVALISRIFSNDRDTYTSSSFQYSINHQNDPLGSFIFSPTNKNLTKLVARGEFKGESIKTQIMFDMYNKSWKNKS